MKFAMWTYPWDVIDQGVEDATDSLRGVGIDEIVLATNYHTVQAFLPHNPHRRTFFAYASSYFQPGDEYGRLQPIPNETMGEEDWLGTVVDGVESTPLSQFVDHRMS